MWCVASLSAGLGAPAAGAGLELELKSEGGCPAEHNAKKPKTDTLAALWRSHPAQPPQALSEPEAELAVRSVELE